MEIYFMKVTLLLDDLEGKDTEEIIELIFAKVKDHIMKKKNSLTEEQNA